MIQGAPGPSTTQGAPGPSDTGGSSQHLSQGWGSTGVRQLCPVETRGPQACGHRGRGRGSGVPGSRCGPVGPAGRAWLSGSRLTCGGCGLRSPAASDWLALDQTAARPGAPEASTVPACRAVMRQTQGCLTSRGAHENVARAPLVLTPRSPRQPETGGGGSRGRVGVAQAPAGTPAFQGSVSSCREPGQYLWLGGPSLLQARP